MRRCGGKDHGTVQCELNVLAGWELYEFVLQAGETADEALKTGNIDVARSALKLAMKIRK